MQKANCQFPSLHPKQVQNICLVFFSWGLNILLVLFSLLSLSWANITIHPLLEGDVPGARRQQLLRQAWDQHLLVRFWRYWSYCGQAMTIHPPSYQVLGSQDPTCLVFTLLCPWHPLFLCNFPLIWFQIIIECNRLVIPAKVVCWQDTLGDTWQM